MTTCYYQHYSTGAKRKCPFLFDITILSYAILPKVSLHLQALPILTQRATDKRLSQMTPSVLASIIE